MFDERLVKKGRQYPIFAILPWGRKSLQLARHHAAELAGGGWQEDDTQKTERLLDQLETENASLKGDRVDAQALTMDERLARQEAKALLRKTYAALRLILRDGPVDGIGMHQFPPLGDMHASGKIVAHITSILELVQRLEPGLARYLGPGAASRLDAAAKRLTQADSDQSTSYKLLPESTLKLQELKGRILERIEELNAVARIVFDGQAEIRARFNKDELLRTRRPETSTAGPSAPALPQA